MKAQPTSQIVVTILENGQVNVSINGSTMTAEELIAYLEIAKIQAVSERNRTVAEFASKYPEKIIVDETDILLAKNGLDYGQEISKDDVIFASAEFALERMKMRQEIESSVEKAENDGRDHSEYVDEN